MFTAIGCDTIGNIDGKNYTTGCLSLRDNIGSVDNGSCSGIGCCQTSIPKAVIDVIVVLSSIDNHSKVLEFNPCDIGFVVEENAYNFFSIDLTNFRNDTVPVVLDWAVGNETCLDARRNSIMHVKQKIVHVMNPTTALDIVAIALLAFKETHTSLMVAMVLIYI